MDEVEKEERKSLANEETNGGSWKYLSEKAFSSVQCYVCFLSLSLSLAITATSTVSWEGLTVVRCH